MNLFKFGDPFDMVINVDNLTRSYRIANKKEIHLFFVGSDKPVELREKDAETVWNFLLSQSRQP